MSRRLCCVLSALAVAARSFAFHPATVGKSTTWRLQPQQHRQHYQHHHHQQGVSTRRTFDSRGIASTPRWRRRRSLRLSGVGSTAAPPPPTQTTSRGGGGEDGIRVLTREESEAAIVSFAAAAKKRSRTQSDFTEYIGMLEGMRSWGEALTKKRVGCKRMVLGNFKRGNLVCISAAEVVWSTGYLSRDVRLSLRLLVVNPKYGMRKVGFETIKRMKAFGMHNALLLDLSPLMAVPSLRVFCLESTQTLDEDPEGHFQDPLVQQYNSRVRRSCYVLDDIPKWADLGPYWYEGVLPRGVRFFFRKRFHAVNEYEVTLQRPGAGLSTGSGTVGGARVIPMDEAEAAKEIPGHGKVREIERRLASRLLEEMQGENPVLTD
ncbi:unnamed protein product [Scytosiphon promiscuus]